ncbi:hypothetical protein [Aliamphritea spongicola]|nr:hypothetical protein [Aliamphritea spongicola]
MQVAELASAFKAAFAATGVPFGYETSCKLVPGKALNDRFLISTHKDAFASKGLKHFCRKSPVRRYRHRYGSGWKRAAPGGPAALWF